MTFLLIPPYLIFAFFVMRGVLKKQNTRKRKWQMGLLTAFLLYLPFGWDVILGRAVFYGLCATQGGVHVYQTVELGPEYFDKDGVQPLYDPKRGFEEINLPSNYLAEINDNRYFSKLLNLSNIEYKIYDDKNGKILGVYKTYMYHGGWFINYTGFYVSGELCPSSRRVSESLSEMVNKVFVN